MRPVLQALLVLAILAFAICLFSVWVGRVREDAASLQCMNNLKQLTLGTLVFHANRKCFPPGKQDNLPIEEKPSWQFALAPLLVGVMDPNLKVDPRKSWKSPKNVGTSKWTLPETLCPARDESLELRNTSYLGIAGVGNDAARLPLGHPQIGFFGYDRVIRENDIKDGLANTINVAESMRDLGPWFATGPATVRGLDPDQPPYVGPGGQFTSGHRTPSLWGQQMRINVSFADGSVRALTETVDPKIWEAMATIAGGEHFELPGY